MYQHILTAATRLKQHLLNSGQKLIRKTQSDSLQGFIARVAAGTFGIKVANAFLAYAISLLLARILGAEGFGSYAYALAWVSLLLIPAVLGLEGVITREVAVYQTKSNWSLAHGLLRWANQVVLLSALILGILAAVVIWVLTPTSDSQTLFTFLIAIISLPFAALARLRQSAMQAIQRIVIGQVPEMLVRPILLIILLGGLSLLGISLSTPWAMGMNTAATGIAFLVGAYLLDRYLPENIKHTPAEYRPLLWLRSALPMLLIGSLYIVNNQTDTVMLGAMKDSEAVGIYTVANRGASLITFVLVAFNTSLAPTFASLYAQGDKRRLQRVVTKGCRMVLLAALPIAFALIAFGYWFLLLFGAEFVQGQTALTILSFGQLANAATGSVALLLIMTGHERDTAIGISASALLNIILNAILIPQWGVEGAATATATSTFFWNIILVVFAQKRLQINSTVLGKLN
ncbi:flippase [Oscillatoria salina]|uniref:flippase n=1 Tax=Oscillatoria salina TaxID=331517 RepID=UPI001CCD42C4|nr:flippase [Oscillatoria salina]MBZ8179099.1 flippase [Oscillatoria salina IIICB1]